MASSPSNDSQQQILSKFEEDDDSTLSVHAFYAMIYIPFTFQLSCTLVPMIRTNQDANWQPRNPECAPAIELFRRHAPYRQLLHRHERSYRYCGLTARCGMTDDEWGLLAMWHHSATTASGGDQTSHLGLMTCQGGWSPPSHQCTHEARLAVLGPWVETAVRSFFPQLSPTDQIVGSVIFECLEETQLGRFDTHPYRLQFWRKNSNSISDWVTSLIPTFTDDVVLECAEQQHTSWGIISFANKEQALAVVTASQHDPSSPINCPPNCVFFS